MKALTRNASGLALAGLLALTAGACNLAEDRDDSRTHVVKREFPAASIQTVDLEGMNGSVEVTSGLADQIVVTAKVKTFRRRTPQEAEQFVRMSVDGQTLYIKEKRARKRHVIILPFVQREDFGVSYAITVPPKMNLNLTNVNGGMDVSGVQGKTELRSVNGSIDVTTPSGEVIARTVNGRVRANFGQEFRGARIRTVNGSIAVSLPQNSSFDCDISQVNGSFKSNVPLTLNVERGGGDNDLDASVNGGRFPLELTTVNGSVTVNQVAAGT
jgi:hypothetical protein